MMSLASFFAVYALQYLSMSISLSKLWIVSLTNISFAPLFVAIWGLII